MRKLALILLILITLSGCAFFKNQKDNWDACKSDPVCSEKAKEWQKTGELVGGIAGSAVPVPGAALPIQKAAGWIALAVAMLVGGSALNKKEEKLVVTNG